MTEGTPSAGVESTPANADQTGNPPGRDDASAPNPVEADAVEGLEATGLSPDKGGQITQEPTSAPATPTPERLGTSAKRVETKEESPSREGDVQVPHKERVRWRLALHLIWLLWTVILLVFLLVGTSRWTNVAFDDVRSVFELMFTALVALVGSAVGFYYGTADGGGDTDE